MTYCEKGQVLAAAQVALLTFGMFSTQYNNQDQTMDHIIHDVDPYNSQHGRRTGTSRFNIYTRSSPCLSTPLKINND